jgi:hypothetical protein
MWYIQYSDKQEDTMYINITQHKLFNNLIPVLCADLLLKWL